MFSELTKKIQRSISLRLAILFCAFFSVCLVLAFTFTYFEVSYSLEKSSREVISAKWREIATVFSSKGQAGLNEFLSTEENRLRNSPFLVRVLTKNGETLFLKPAVQDGAFDFEKASNRLSQPEKIRGWHFLKAIDDEDRFDIFTEQISDGIFLQLGRSSEDREDILESIEFGFLTMAGLLVMVSAVFGFWYARRSLKPIHTLTETIQFIEAGDLKQRVLLANSQDELRDLGETFNRMIARMERLILGMRESLDNVAHDIQTPLTRIRVRAEGALLTNDPVAKTVALEECAENVAEISGLVAQLLDISEGEAGAMQLKLELVDVLALLRDVVEIYEFVAEESGVEVHIDVQDGLKWTVDRKRIKQVVGNLLDNAIKFSPSQTGIILSAAESENSLVISVEDQGIGISESELPRIWDRLFRGDKSRSTKGMGIGLALVRSIVLAHRGSVSADPKSEGGTVFRVAIPRAALSTRI